MAGRIVCISLLFAVILATSADNCEYLANFEDFPIVTDFNWDDCDYANNFYYNPTLYCDRLPGCVQQAPNLCDATAPCPPGYVCNGGKCTIDEDLCWRYYYDKNAEAVWRPTCNNDGTWQPKQCKGDRCFCYDAKGGRIYGQAFLDQATNMTCACSRKRADLEASENSDYYFVSLHCDQMGNYEPLQCLKGQCWCVEPKTGEILTPTVPEQIMKRLPCYDSKEIGSQYLRRCESQVYAQAKIRDEFNAHGTGRISFSALSCQYDGSFGPTKIDSGSIHCVWRDNSATGYFADLSGTNIADVDCHCAIDKKIYESVGLELLRTCLANGNYDRLQKVENEYYCVDSDGFRISEIMAINGQTDQALREECETLK